VVLAEAKQGCIKTLNGPWAKRGDRVLDYVLQPVGIVPAQCVAHIAEELYDMSKAAGHGFTIRICVFAESASNDLLSQGVTFVDWNSVLEFIHKRFHDNSKFKRDHVVWDKFGQYLWQSVEACPATDYKQFFQDWDKSTT
jgi:hypothetical protein